MKERWKGLGLLLHALPSVIARYPNLKLVVAGKVWKDDFSKYDRLIRENNLEKYINLHIRYILDDDVATFYCAADLIVLPYLRIYQSGVLLMAMSYGVPAVVSDLEGMVEVVNDGVDGFLFQNGDVTGLSSKLIDALSDNRRLKLVARAGVGKMERNHSWQSIGRQTVKLYQEIH